jgi:hypothetical protein
VGAFIAERSCSQHIIMMVGFTALMVVDQKLWDGLVENISTLGF